MAKAADIGSKRLISLASTAWARWVTGDSTIETSEMLSSDFQWVARANDALIKVSSQQHGTFLVANEIQFRPDERMPKRVRVYAALGEERYDLPVVPIVVNILPPSANTQIADSYNSEFMGFKAHQDFKVINLWTVDANLVFEQNLTTLLPFVPILKGGESEILVSKAILALRASKEIAELEPLLAFFASFVLDTETVRKIMRWDMAILRESPWYNEILQEGIEQGLEQGLEQGQTQMLLHVLRHRFGALPPDLETAIRKLPLAVLPRIADIALGTTSLEQLVNFIQSLSAADKSNQSQ